MIDIVQHACPGSLRTSGTVSPSASMALFPWELSAAGTCVELGPGNTLRCWTTWRADTLLTSAKLRGRGMKSQATGSTVPSMPSRPHGPAWWL